MSNPKSVYKCTRQFTVPLHLRDTILFFSASDHTRVRAEYGEDRSGVRFHPALQDVLPPDENQARHTARVSAIVLQEEGVSQSINVISKTRAYRAEGDRKHRLHFRGPSAIGRARDHRLLIHESVARHRPELQMFDARGDKVHVRVGPEQGAKDAVLRRRGERHIEAFFPPPDGDGVRRIDTDRQQQLAGRRETQRANT